MERTLLPLGNPSLYERSRDVLMEDLPLLRQLAEDLHDTLGAHRLRHEDWYAISAPQIGVNKRLFCINITGPVTFINPVIYFPGDEMVEVTESCMCFPGLRVKLMRYRECVLHYRNLDWQRREVMVEDDMAIMVQHQVDHLDGILATMRAKDSRSFFMDFGD